MPESSQYSFGEVSEGKCSIQWAFNINKLNKGNEKVSGEKIIERRIELSKENFLP
jgi:hypothetical protein